MVKDDLKIRIALQTIICQQWPEVCAIGMLDCCVMVEQVANEIGISHSLVQSIPKEDLYGWCVCTMCVVTTALQCV
jgi:hypothetical protein